MLTLQYKFVVDGEWRHDEHQPCVTVNSEVVNTVFIAREQDTVPVPIPVSEAAGRMEVDDVFMSPVSGFFHTFRFWLGISDP